MKERLVICNEEDTDGRARVTTEARVTDDHHCRFLLAIC